MRCIIGQILKSLGFEVLEASNGQEGLQRLEGGDRPKLVMVDWNMPVMDGLSFVRADARPARIQSDPGHDGHDRDRDDPDGRGPRPGGQRVCHETVHCATRSSRNWSDCRSQPLELPRSVRRGPDLEAADECGPQAAPDDPTPIRRIAAEAFPPSSDGGRVVMKDSPDFRRRGSRSEWS